VARDGRDVDDRPTGRLHDPVGLLRHGQRRQQVEGDDLGVEVGAGLRRQGERCAPGVVHHHVEQPVVGDDAVDHHAHRLGVAEIDGVELQVGHVGAFIGGPARAGDDHRAGLPEDRADAGAHAAYAPRDEDDLPRQTQIDVRHAC